MKKLNLKDYTRGWIVGGFQPSIFETSDMEVGVKRFSAGEKESKHMHKLSHEATVVISGRIKMNGVEYGPDDIVLFEPEESTEFEAMTDAITLCIRNGSNRGDKYDM